MRIIIAIDIIDGKCVRLTKGDFATQKIYNEDPLEVAKHIEDNGISFVHLVDLDGARAKRIVNNKILETITQNTSLKIDFSGGIRSREDIITAFNYGANQVVCGSVSIDSPEIFLEWLSEFGEEKIILGADSRNRKVSTNGWMKESDNDIIKFITGYYKKGVRYAVSTDIEKDGMLDGPSTGLYGEIMSASGIKLIASGGISTLQNIEELSIAGCEGAIIGKAVYEGKLTLKELSELC
jgi:phosphoribosylformimino-5-aminoimidazole carboxamide ribotide isomerase